MPMIWSLKSGSTYLKDTAIPKVTAVKEPILYEIPPDVSKTSISTCLLDQSSTSLGSAIMIASLEEIKKLKDYFVSFLNLPHYVFDFLGQHIFDEDVLNDLSIKLIK